MLVLLLLGSVGLLGGIQTGIAKAEPKRMSPNYLAATVEEESWPRREKRSMMNDCASKERAISPNIRDMCQAREATEPNEAEETKKAIEPLLVCDDGPADSATAETHGRSLIEPSVATKLGKIPMKLTAK